MNRRLAALAAVGAACLLAAAAGLALSQPTGPDRPPTDYRPAKAIADQPVVLYLVTDLKTNEVVAGPFVIPLSELDVGRGHGYKTVLKIDVPRADGAAATGGEPELTPCTITCQAARPSKDTIGVMAAVDLAGSHQLKKESLSISDCTGALIRLPKDGEARFLFVYSVCEPVCRAEMGG